MMASQKVRLLSCPASLPVDEAVPELKKILAEKGMAILKAPPGSGKTTLVPLRLMDEPWLENRKILVLEPRRLAARLAAFRMSEVTCSRLGEKIGYHVRMDRKTGPSAKIEVLTEGILTRRIQADPMLEEAGLVIFDEFHERSIHADLGLALCLETREVFRNDLRILVMSATMDTERLSALMGNAAVINASGSLFPVDVIYEKESLYSVDDRLERKAGRKITSVINETEGDILVFLPGTGEIARTAEYLGQGRLPDSVEVHQLHGNLSLSEQEKAITPDPSGRRKIVLSTSIAETSLTIEGVRTVIDCGLSRVPRFDSSRGMTALETVPESLASAEQRRGRAGRLGPGKCYRMWPESRKHLFPDFSQPEIRTTDLSSFALDLAMWGVSSPSDLKLMDQPPEGSFGHAINLLNLLGALGTNGSVTEKGREMASLGVHPRLASMLISGKKAGFLRTAARIAALAGERDILDSSSGADEDIRTRLEILEKISHGDRITGMRTDIRRCRGILETASYLERISCTEKNSRKNGEDRAGILIASAYPERIAGKRDKRGSFITRSAGGAFLPETSHLAGEEYLAIADMTSGGTGAGRGNSRIRLAAPIGRDEIESLFGDDIRTATVTSWNDASLSVDSRRIRSLGNIVLDEKIEPDPPEQDVLLAMTEGIGKNWPGILPWTARVENLRLRVSFLRQKAGLDSLPDLSAGNLRNSIDEWLVPYISGMKSSDDLKKLDMETIFMTMIGWENAKFLDDEAPERFRTPSGSNVVIDYSAFESDAKSGGHPVIRVKLQEMFGLKTTPCLGSHKIPVMLHLLSPASRPVQITMDLEGFWKGSYFEVRKEMKGRYPKHFWPDNPADAPATKGPRPRDP